MDGLSIKTLKELGQDSHQNKSVAGYKGAWVGSRVSFKASVLDGPWPRRATSLSGPLSWLSVFYSRFGDLDKLSAHSHLWEGGLGDSSCVPFFHVVSCSWLPVSWVSSPSPNPLGFPGGSDGKESACNARDPGSIPGWGISPGEGNDNPLQYSCLENPMDRGAWWARKESHMT